MAAFTGFFKGQVASVPLGTIGFYFLASRLLIVLLAVLSMEVIRPGAFAHSAHLIDTFARWDSSWYKGIAALGYNYSPTHQSNVAFFPLYPLVLHLVSFGIHDLRIAGYVISNACLFASCVVLWKMVERHYGSEAVADRTVLFLLLCPVSFFFSVIYSEGLFFLLFVLAAYFAADRRWLAAGVCGCLMALCRPVGILVVLLLAAEFAGQCVECRRDFGWREGMRSVLRASGLPFLFSVALTGAGLGSYCLYLWIKFGEPLAFLKAEEGWSRHFSAPWNAFHADSDTSNLFYAFWFQGAVVLAFVIFAAGLVLRMRPSHSFIAVAYMVFYLSTNRLEAMPRFLSILFPLYIVLALASVRWPRLEPMLLAGSTMLLAVSTILFVNGYWFT